MTSKYVFVLDCYLHIPANTIEEARDLAENLDEEIGEKHGFALAILDAFGITDAENGQEIREVK